MTRKKKGAGIAIKAPNKKCNDITCPFHGNLKVRGRSFVGTVCSTNMQKTVTVEWGRLLYLKKFERYEEKRTKLKAHVPSCIQVIKGDKVRIYETRPLSKTKHFVVVENLGQDISFIAKQEGMLAAKIRREEHIENEGETKKKKGEKEKENESN